MVRILKKDGYREAVVNRGCSQSSLIKSQRTTEKMIKELGRCDSFNVDPCSWKMLSGILRSLKSLIGVDLEEKKHGGTCDGVFMHHLAI